MAVTTNGLTFRVDAAERPDRGLVSIRVLGLPIHNTPGGNMKPKWARSLAAELLKAADKAEGKERATVIVD